MNPSTTSLQPHADFVEVKFRTAKCDLCEKHNKLTLYRCIQCGQHVCSLCWEKPGDEMHVFGGGSHNVPESNTNKMIENGNGNRKKGDPDAGRVRARRRVILISDGEDDDLPVLKPASTIRNAKATDARKQQRHSIDVIMDDSYPHHHHEDDLPGLWPIVPGSRPPVLRPAEPTAHTSAAACANSVTEENTHNYVEKNRAEHQGAGRVYDEPGRQMVPSRNAFVGNQAPDLHAPPPQSSIPNQQATYSAHLHAQPAKYRPRPGIGVDQQAARIQHAFTDSQPTNRQAPRPVHPSTAQQDPRLLQPAIYRPRPGTDVDQQAARNQLAFANGALSNYQVSRPGQGSISHQQVVRPASLSAPDSVFISQRHVQAAAIIDRAAVRNQQIAYLQNVQARAAAKQMEARDPHALGSRQNAWPIANRDQIADQNQQAFNSNQHSSSAAAYEQMLAARNQQQTYLARQQANRPTSSPARVSLSSTGATNTFRSPTQPTLLQQSAALLASRKAQYPTATEDHANGPWTGTHTQEYSPEVIEAADALLHYARVEQYPGSHSSPGQDANGDAHLLGAANPARSNSPTSSKTRNGQSEAAGTQSMSSGASALNPTFSGAGSDSTKSRLNERRTALVQSHSPSGSCKTDIDHSVDRRGHLGYRDTAMQTESEHAPANPSPTQVHESSPHRAQPHIDSKLPMSDHAATYLDQWNSGRAALSSRSRSTASDVSTPQLSRPRSAVPARKGYKVIKIRYEKADGSGSGGAAEAGIQEPSTPISLHGGPDDVDVRMGSPEVEIFEDGESLHQSEAWAPEKKSGTIGKDKDSEKRPRDEKKDGSRTSKEHKKSDDIDVVDARNKNSKEGHPEQIDDDNDDDDDDDVQITSWNKLDGNNMIDNRPGASAEAKGRKRGKSMKKGVAYVKKPEPKGRKG